MTSQLKIGINGLPQAYPLFNAWLSNPALTSNGGFSGASEIQRRNSSRKFIVGSNINARAAISSKVNEEYITYSTWAEMVYRSLRETIFERKKAEVINISLHLKTDIYQDLKAKVSGYSAIQSDDDFEAPNDKTIKDALFFIDNIIKKQGVKVSRVRPVADGEINFFWSNSDFTLDVALYGDDKYYYYFEDKSKGIKYSREKSLEQALDVDALNMIKSKW